MNVNVLFPKFRVDFYTYYFIFSLQLGIILAIGIYSVILRWRMK